MDGQKDRHMFLYHTNVRLQDYFKGHTQQAGSISSISFSLVESQAELSPCVSYLACGQRSWTQSIKPLKRADEVSQHTNTHTYSTHIHQNPKKTTKLEKQTSEEQLVLLYVYLDL